MGNGYSATIGEALSDAAPVIGDAASGIRDLCLESVADAYQGVFGHRVHVVACASDNGQSSRPHAYTAAASSFCNLVHACGTMTTEALFNEQATLLEVRRAVQRVGACCGRGDTFVFYFAGNCKLVQSYDLSESGEGPGCVYSKAFCLVDQLGRSSPESWLRVDDFARLVTSNISRGVKVLMVLDCCCEGGIMDAAVPWKDYEAVAISNSDTESPFTSSLIQVVEMLKRNGAGDYSVGQLRSAWLQQEGKTPMVVESRPAELLSEMPWPFIPQRPSAAPLKQEDESVGLRKAMSFASTGKMSPESPATPLTTFEDFQPCLAFPEGAPQCKDGRFPEDPFCLQAAGTGSPSPRSLTTPSPVSAGPGLYVVVCALDSETTAHTADGACVVDFARHCNATRVESLFNANATISNLKKTLALIGGEIRPGDRLVLFCAGGAPGPAAGGGLRLAGEAGGVAELPGEDLARLLTKSLHPSTSILVLADGYTAGLVADLGKEEWATHETILITGCSSAQSLEEPATSSGLLTRLLLNVVRTPRPAKERAQSVGAVYNLMLNCIQEDALGAHEINLQAALGVSPFLTHWPLWPSRPYEALGSLDDGALSKPSEIKAPWIPGNKENPSMTGTRTGVSSNAARVRNCTTLDVARRQSFQDAISGSGNESYPTLLTTPSEKLVKAPVKDSQNVATSSKQTVSPAGLSSGDDEGSEQAAAEALPSEALWRSIVASPRNGRRDRIPTTRIRRRDILWKKLFGNNGKR